MKRINQIITVICLLFVLNLSVIAGDIETTVAPPMLPPTSHGYVANGDIETTVGENANPLNSIVEASLNIVSNMLLLV